MHRWQFKVCCILMGWSDLEAALALNTTLGTITKLQSGDLDEILTGAVIESAKKEFFRANLPKLLGTL